MIGYRKRSFWLAHKQLENPRTDSDDLKSLRELQVLIEYFLRNVRLHAFVAEFGNHILKLER